MAKYRFTHTDIDGNQILVGDNTIAINDHGARLVAYLPVDPARVALARAVLPDSGDTGHLVVSTEESARAIRIRESIAAEDMRDRIIAALGSPQYAAAAIRALPLLPDGDDTEAQEGEVSAGHHVNPVARKNEVQPDVHVATPEGITPCGEGHHDVTVAALVTEATCMECLRTLAHLNGTARPVTDYEPSDRSDYDHGFSDGLAMGHQSPPATGDADLIQQVRALVKRYGAPVIAAEAARQAQRT